MGIMIFETLLVIVRNEPTVIGALLSVVSRIFKFTHLVSVGKVKTLSQSFTIESQNVF